MYYYSYYLTQSFTIRRLWGPSPPFHVPCSTHPCCGMEPIRLPGEKREEEDWGPPRAASGGGDTTAARDGETTAGAATDGGAVAKLAEEQANAFSAGLKDESPFFRFDYFEAEAEAYVITASLVKCMRARPSMKGHTWPGLLLMMKGTQVNST